jgi:MoaA/NifB/PqqE/SkfB family radical SAM enzyme
MAKDRFQAFVGESGELILPEDLKAQYGLNPGAKVYLEATTKGIRLKLPITHLNKIYIEPTNSCNLDCVTCMRKAWNEPIGIMKAGTFSQIMDGLKEFSTPATVIFGGLGEPLSHPDIIEMVARAKSLNSTVELITNGTLLTRDTSVRLIEAGLDRLWVSLDGANPESYGDIRLGALFPEVINNLKLFHNAREYNHSPSPFSSFHPRPELGIVFVAMKRNIHDLPSLLSLATKLGAGRVMVSNVLPYSHEIGKEILYSRSLNNVLYQSSPFQLDLPKIDVDETTKRSLYSSIRAGHSLSLARGHFGEGNDYCPFIENGAAAISWEGSLSPCLALLHTHKNYFDGIERFCRRYLIGNVNASSIKTLWETPEYLSFRERVQNFEFSPCTYCAGGCALFEENEKDCLGNSFPTCGGCLWAQGIVQCP